MTTLNQFEGRDVVGTRVAITNAGDGLSQAMLVEPAEYHIGDVVTVVIECVVKRVSYEPVKDTDVLNRVQVLKAGTAAIIEASKVKKLLDQQRIKIEKARGVERLDFGGDDGDGDE